jgi:hypothetical protein
MSCGLFDRHLTTPTNTHDVRERESAFNEKTGQFQIEIKGLAEPKSKEASRICREDLNEVIAAFVQDKTALERGMFDEELVPEELTQVRMGKIIKDKYPELDEEDHEAVRQHAVAALNLTQQAKKLALGGGGDDTEQTTNTALIDGVRRYAMDVRELDIDLIDRINPFGEAYAILAKTMSEDSLKQVAAVIAAKRTSLTPEEAKELAVRAFRFKKERGRLPSLTSQDAGRGLHSVRLNTLLSICIAKSAWSGSGLWWSCSSDCTTARFRSIWTRRCARLSSGWEDSPSKSRRLLTR